MADAIFVHQTAMTQPSLSPGSADVLLFDLGRVVLDINFEKVMTVWAGHAGCAPADLAGRFVVDDHFRHHEIGRIDDAAFFASLRNSLRIGISDDQFLEGWNAIFAGEMPGISEHLARAGKRMPLYAFSNTNPMSSISRRPMRRCSAISARSFCRRPSGFGNRTWKRMIMW
jgi:putative hydrolase of the HAD superfamily